MHIYNPLTKETSNKFNLLQEDFSTVEEIYAAGWKDLDIKSFPTYDNFFYLLEEDGVRAVRDTDTYEVQWKIVDRSLLEVKKELIKKLANKRYTVETGGLLFNGFIIRTDRGSQAQLTSAKVSLDLDPTAIVSWKSNTGRLNLDKEAVSALAGAVASHVRLCFSKELDLTDEIEAATSIHELRQVYINDGWPETANINKDLKEDPLG